MSPEQELQSLLQQARDGVPDAARKLHDLYAEPILHVVRRKLNPRLRTAYDSVDFTQMVWQSFFSDILPKMSFDSPRHLVAFLAAVAEKKVLEAQRRCLQRPTHDLHRECSLDDPGHPGRDLTDPRPSAERAAAARDEFDRLLEGKTPRQRAVLILLREGHSHDEIAARLNIDARVVRRFLLTVRVAVS